MENTQKSTPGPVRLALTGGIGSGKSTALMMFHARGAAVLSSDMVVHRLLDDDAVRESVAESLGIPRFPAGEEGRRQLAEIVFNDEERLDQLEAILFPLVAAELEAWFASPGVASTELAVIEVPMLFEADMQDRFDSVALITAPEDIRKVRHEGRVGLSDFEQRSSRQLPEVEKRARSDFTYDNTASPEELDEFVAATVAALTAR
jgi:dephospho-CoA kinase